MIAKIISGGQTGADLGGLLAGRDLRIPTGGYAPHGWMTECGPNPRLAEFGLVEHQASNYPARTLANVVTAHATVIFAEQLDGGSALTAKLCSKNCKPFIVIPGFGLDESERFECFIRSSSYFSNGLVLNVAGNRESKAPGIGRAVQWFLIDAINAIRRCAA